jgi:hypothetical protein
MKNLKKLKRTELNTILGGVVPVGCSNWNPRERCCRAWDDGYQDKPTCPAP